MFLVSFFAFRWVWTEANFGAIMSYEVWIEFFLSQKLIEGLHLSNFCLSEESWPGMERSTRLEERGYFLK
jgi:hypothetical protein